ncbi:MAG: folP [Herminiimonas sp.]|nr:folP [Herminiimonas sp.]
MNSYLQCGRFRLPVGLSDRPAVMGILNVTPDSFSDGGRFCDFDTAMRRAEAMIAEGVDIIDVGGESTRPGADSLSAQQELDRVMPVVEALRECGKPVSVDTSKPEVMRAALQSGADMINDVHCFLQEGAQELVRNSSCGLCLVHMQRQPQTMQENPHYADVVSEVIAFLSARAKAFTEIGVAPDRICVDPGFGFGKTLAHNLALLRSLDRLRDVVGFPVLTGMSRKSMLGAITSRAVEDRQAASLAGAMVAAERGARIIRVHDVAQTVDALKVWQAAR